MSLNAYAADTIHGMPNVTVSPEDSYILIDEKFEDHYRIEVDADADVWIYHAALEEPVLMSGVAALELANAIQALLIRD